MEINRKGAKKARVLSIMWTRKGLKEGTMRIFRIVNLKAMMILDLPILGIAIVSLLLLYPLLHNLFKRIRVGILILYNATNQMTQSRTTTAPCPSTIISRMKWKRPILQIP